MACIKFLVIAKINRYLHRNVFAVDPCDCPGLPPFLEHTLAMAVSQVIKKINQPTRVEGEGSSGTIAYTVIIGFIFRLRG